MSDRLPDAEWADGQTDHEPLPGEALFLTTTVERPEHRVLRWLPMRYEDGGMAVVPPDGVIIHALLRS